MPIEVPSYVQVRRKTTDDDTNVGLKLYEEEIEWSHVVDTLWIIAKRQANMKNGERQIPNWTGFNYLL